MRERLPSDVFYQIEDENYEEDEVDNEEWINDLGEYEYGNPGHCGRNS